MIRYIIVDDEPIAHRIIESFANDFSHLKLLHNCYSAMEAMEFLHTNEVELLFLDINMPKITGLEFVKMLRMPPKVIITSAYEEYALEGYELNVTDYLLKPFSFERFAKAIQKVTIGESNKKEIQVSASATRTERIFVKGDKKHHQIALDELLFVESVGSYCKVVLQNESLITHEKISNFERILPVDQFIRCHKSFIVSKTHIKTIEGNRILLDAHQIPIGQTYKTGVRNLLL